MKFTVNVTGEATLGLPEQDFEIEAASGGEAVDSARAQLEKLLPPEGGSLEIVVEATEDWEQIANGPGGRVVRETIPAGVVSTFSVRFEPHESVRAEVDAKRAADAAAAETAAAREALKLELLAEIEAEQRAAGKAVSR